MKTETKEHKAFTIEDVPAIGLTGRQVTLDIFALSILKDKCDSINGIILDITNPNHGDVRERLYEGLIINTQELLVFMDKITQDIDNIHDVADELFGVDVKDEYNDEFKRELKK